MFKIMFCNFFTLNDRPSNFFFFFSAALFNSFFFFKLISLKKKYVYTPRPRSTFYLKSSFNVAKTNFVLTEPVDFVEPAEIKRSTKERSFSLQKTFLNYKRVCFRNLRDFYGFKFLRRRHLLSFFSNFKKKNFSELSSFFSLNILRVLHRIFPFFNFFLLRRLLLRGFVLLNFKKVTSLFVQLRVGDFISIFFLTELWGLIRQHVQLQTRHVFRVKKKLFMAAKLKGLRQEKAISQHLSRSFRKFTFTSRRLPS